MTQTAAVPRQRCLERVYRSSQRLTKIKMPQKRPSSFKTFAQINKRWIHWGLNSRIEVHSSARRSTRNRLWLSLIYHWKCKAWLIIRSKLGRRWWTITTFGGCKTSWRWSAGSAACTFSPTKRTVTTRCVKHGAWRSSRWKDWTKILWRWSAELYRPDYRSRSLSVHT